MISPRSRICSTLSGHGLTDLDGEIDLLVASDGARSAVKFLLDQDVPEDLTYQLRKPFEILRALGRE